MSGDVQEKQGLFSRTVPHGWVLTVVGALVLAMAVIAVTLVLVDRDRDRDRRALADAATSTTGVTSPYDLTELPADTDIDAIEDAAFVSIFVPNENGMLTSYGLNADLPIARALIDAVQEADKVDPDVAASELGSRMGEARIAFVLPTRDTMTFVLWMEEGMIGRGDSVWRPEGDLRALVDTAVAGP